MNATDFFPSYNGCSMYYLAENESPVKQPRYAHVPEEQGLCFEDWFKLLGNQGPMGSTPSLASSYHTLPSSGDAMDSFEALVGNPQHAYWLEMAQDMTGSVALPLQPPQPQQPQQQHQQQRQHGMSSYSVPNLWSSQVETDDHSLQCLWSQCYVRTATLDQLIVHIRDVHVGSGKSAYFCGWAGCPRRRKPFTKRHKMHNHMRTHTGERPFACTVQGCNKRFSRPDSLSTHIKTHSNVRPYPCRVQGCNKAYFHSRSLRKHTKAHEDEARRSMPNNSITSSSSRVIPMPLHHVNPNLVFPEYPCAGTQQLTRAH